MHKVLINSVDRTAVIFEADYDIRHVTGGQINTVKFTIDDPALAITVTKGDDLVIEDSSDATVRFFGGIVEAVEFVPDGLGRQLNIMGSDWKILTDKATVTKIYFNTTDKAIIQAAFTSAGVTEINTSTYVSAGQTIDRLDLRGNSLGDLLDAITNITGWIWDIDAFKNLIYREGIFIEGSKGFSDTPDNVLTFPVIGIKRDTSQGSYNAVEVFGVERMSANITDVYSGNGVKTVYYLGEATQAGTEILSRIPTTDFAAVAVSTDRILVQRNGGTDGTPVWNNLNVGLEGQDSLLLKDVLWNPAIVRLEFSGSKTPPNFANNAFRVRGRYFGPLRVLVQDPKAITDNNNRIFKYSLVEPNIVDRNSAISVGMAFLAEQGDQDIVTFEFDVDGIEAATVVPIKHKQLGILTSTLYHVIELTTFVRGGTVFGYAGTFAAHPRLS
jgi:hypothetical protein